MQICGTAHTYVAVSTQRIAVCSSRILRPQIVNTTESVVNPYSIVLACNSHKRLSGPGHACNQRKRQSFATGLGRMGILQHVRARFSFLREKLIRRPFKRGGLERIHGSAIARFYLAGVSIGRLVRSTDERMPLCRARGRESQTSSLAILLAAWH